MKLNKITITSSGASLDYTEPHGDDTVAATFTSEKAPAPDFLKAFAALVPDAVRLIDAPKAYERDVTVYQIAIKRDEQGRRGFVLSCTKKVRAGSITFNTPLQREFLAPDEKGVRYTTEDMLDKIEAVIDEAVEYFKGKVAQPELALDDGEKLVGQETVEGTTEVVGTAKAPKKKPAAKKPAAKAKKARASKAAPDQIIA